LPQEAQLKAVQRIIDRAGLRGVEGLVRLPRDKVLRRVVDLPAAAAENLREVLGFEMDRQTPFKAEEVCFDFRISGQDPQRKRIKVDLVVVPREVVDRVMRLADAWGVDFELVDMGGKTIREDQLFDLLPRASRAVRGQLRRRLTFAAGILTAAMLSAAVYFPLQTKYDDLASLEAQLARARADAAKVDEMRQQVENLTTRSRFVVELKGKQRSATEALNEVTRLLPDTTWVLKFGVRNNRLNVSGYSAKPSALIGLLEDSAMFASVRFSSPVTMDQKVGLERFNLTATVLGRDS
jgi:general secretion pathway protein L